MLDFWPVAIKMMNQDDFLKNLQTYDKENIEEDRIKKLQEFVKNPKFNLDHLRTISPSPKISALGSSLWTSSTM